MEELITLSGYEKLLPVPGGSRAELAEQYVSATRRS
jgi:hypothetical protein